MFFRKNQSFKKVTVTFESYCKLYENSCDSKCLRIKEIIDSEIHRYIKNDIIVEQTDDFETDLKYNSVFNMVLFKLTINEEYLTTNKLVKLEKLILNILCRVVDDYTIDFYEHVIFTKVILDMLTEDDVSLSYDMVDYNYFDIKDFIKKNKGILNNGRKKS